MELKYKDPKKVATRAMILVHTNHPELTQPEKDELAKTEKWLNVAKETLVAAAFIEKNYEELKEMMSYAQVNNWAMDILNNIPQELLTNVEEWLEGRELSTIQIHDVSIPYLMKEFNVPFCSALKCIARWKESGFAGKEFCYNYFARA